MQILLVEDDLRLGKMIQVLLQKQQYVVTWLTDGSEVEAYAMTDRFDLILLDWMLPELSGLEVLKKLRMQKVSTPVIMMTAKGEIEDKLSGFETGADDYIVKPFDFQELNMRIIALHRRSLGRATNNIEQGPIVINTMHNTVHIHNEEVHLTHKEYQLLKLLMEYQGVVSKEMILDKVWSIDEIVSDNNVETLIKRLRQKIGKQMVPYKIKSIRNMGYTMVKDE